MAITASLVKELRERTGAGMMECKRALVEADGSIDTAIENMRKSGLAKADKKAGRVAAEGAIAIALSEDGKTAAIVEVNSETDFVSKGDEFKAFAQSIANAALANKPASVEELAACEFEAGQSIDQKRQAMVAKIGENIQVRRFQILTAPQGSLGIYQHGERIAAVVSYEGGESSLGKDLAMHVAASNPRFINADAVPEDVVNKEKEILLAQPDMAGKPEEIVEKMIQGRLRKFLAEISMYGQPFVKDPDQTVEKLLKSQSASISEICRFEVGEGIEKKEENFAEEVMAQVKG